MDDVLNETQFLEKMRSNIKKTYENIDDMFDLIIERIESKKKLVTKFEESISEYEYEPEIATNEEIKRMEQFGEAVKEIIGI